jgi:hypothetical protein
VIDERTCLMSFMIGRVSFGITWYQHQVWYAGVVVVSIVHLVVMMTVLFDLPCLVSSGSARPFLSSRSRTQLVESLRPGHRACSGGSDKLFYS